MELHLKISGMLMIVISLIHFCFPAYFKWVKELEPLTLMNRQMMYIHTLFIALTVLLMGILCYTSATDIVHTKLGKQLAMGLCIFWTIRLLVQFWGYSSKLWKGKQFETIVHILFSLLWAYFSAVFFMVWLDLP